MGDARVYRRCALGWPDSPPRTAMLAVLADLIPLGVEVLGGVYWEGAANTSPIKRCVLRWPGHRVHIAADGVVKHERLEVHHG